MSGGRQSYKVRRPPGAQADSCHSSRFAGNAAPVQVSHFLVAQERADLQLDPVAGERCFSPAQAVPRGRCQGCIGGQG